MLPGLLNVPQCSSLWLIYSQAEIKKKNGHKAEKYQPGTNLRLGGAVSSLLPVPFVMSQNEAWVTYWKVGQEEIHNGRTLIISWVSHLSRKRRLLDSSALKYMDVELLKHPVVKVNSLRALQTRQKWLTHSARTRSSYNALSRRPSTWIDNNKETFFLLFCQLRARKYTGRGLQ